MKSSEVATSSLRLPMPWLAGMGEQVVVSREGQTLRIESKAAAAARRKLRKIVAGLQATAADAGITNRVVAHEVKAVRTARAQRAVRR